MMFDGMEIHTGIVGEIENDYTQIALKTPAGKEYERYFSTRFLQNCGITEPGGKIKCVFNKQTFADFGIVYMLVIKDEAINDEALAQQVAEIISAVDLEKIRTKFGRGGKV